jgi:two-component system LytT family sensor kinase
MLVSAIWLWPAVFGVVDRVANGRLQGWGPASAAELLFQFWDWLAYAIVTPAIFWASARWPVIGASLRRHFTIHLALALLFCVVWATVGKILQFTIVSLVEPDALLRGISDAGPDLGAAVARNVIGWILTTIPFGVVVYTTVAALAHAITYFSEAREREAQVARMAEQLATARFSALQSQVNPHFLFNTLNTIAVLVRDGERDGAVRIVEQLSDVLRRSLSRHRGNEVTLDEELDLVRQYLAIEQARFPDRLRASFDVGPGVAAAAVPGFAVQHLVENAIRHGIARREEAGRIAIVARREGGSREGDSLVVTVADDGPGIGVAEPPAGHGIANTRERLRLLHGDRASLDVVARAEGGTRATLRVPFRELAIEAERADA